METYNKCKVVMLPTCSGDNFPILKNVNGRGNNLYIPTLGYYYTETYLKESQFEPQHLYILSEEEIKEGDWCLGKDSDGKNYLIQMNNTTSPKFHYEIHKIIASTDLNLRIPQIHQSFISLCIEEYNAGRKIEKVEVEYEEYFDQNAELGDDWGGHKSIKNILKINSDNTISIKPLRNNWSREEVELKLFNLRRDMKFANDFSDNFMNNWIKQNL